MDSKLMTDEELEKIRTHVMKDFSRYGPSMAEADSRALLVEVDRLRAELKDRKLSDHKAAYDDACIEIERLRRLDGLARGWLKWDDIHEYALQPTAGIKTVAAKESYRAAIESEGK